MGAADFESGSGWLWLPEMSSRHGFVGTGGTGIFCDVIRKVEYTGTCYVIVGTFGFISAKLFGLLFLQVGTGACRCCLQFESEYRLDSFF